MQFAPLYPILYKILKPSFPSCLWAGVNQKAIALTFDDGPHPQYTPELLQVLDYYKIPASFFWLGLCVDRSQDVARAVFERGHWLGLHGYEHRSFPQLKPDQLKQSLAKTQLAISLACGIAPDTMCDVRPPNGLFTPQTITLLEQWNYRPVMWSVVPEDWERPGISIVVQRVLRQVKNGSIIVLHDGYSGGPDVAQTTAQLIPQLLQQGYQFVTIEQLWRQRS
ncbi:MAG: polysaccharide deacetylase family protein [Coleofasciculaceae cyanobacterium]